MYHSVKTALVSAEKLVGMEDAPFTPLTSVLF